MRRTKYPKFVQAEETRHGRIVYYFRCGKDFSRIRLPDNPASDEFKEAYRLALKRKDMTRRKGTPEPFEIQIKQSVEKAFRGCLHGAKQRAREKGRECDLTLAWLLSEVERQEFKCALTGIRFFSPSDSTSDRNPYAPSLDRIDCREGYTKGNVRVVILAINIMLADWGQAVFERVAKHYKRNIERTSYALPKAKCGQDEEYIQKIQSLRKRAV